MLSSVFRAVLKNPTLKVQNVMGGPSLPHQSDGRFLTTESSVSETSETLSLGSKVDIFLVAPVRAGGFRCGLEMHARGAATNLLALGPQWSYDGNSWIPQAHFQNR